MRYLIDGYNLLHATGAARSRMGPAGLDHARLRLLGLLKGAYGDDAHLVCIVFDGSGLQTERHADQGLRVLYTGRSSEADDLIEDLIRHDSVPARLTVVSDDHRLKDAARRRGCAVLGCLDYIDELRQIRARHHQRLTPETEKTAPGSVTFWLQEFADAEGPPGPAEDGSAPK